VSRLAFAAALLLAGCAAAPRPGVAPPPQSPLPLAELPAQALPKGRCALFLWERAAGPGRRILMVTAQPGQARVVWRGAVVDLPQTAASGEAAYGIAPKASYAGAGLTIDLDLDFAAGTPLAGGLVVRDGSLAFTPAGGDTVIVGVAGLIGCG
jgi:hypothetical protein